MLSGFLYRNATPLSSSTWSDAWNCAGGGTLGGVSASRMKRRWPRSTSASARLKRPFGSATLMITANLPDVDVFVFATSVPSVAFRRGWTHGIVAQVLLPILFAAVMMAIERVRPSRDPSVRARWGWLLLLSYVGVLSHVGLDLLNNYGVRLLMPFSNHWFYGDTLFIADPWLWAALGAGLWLARTRRRVQPG